MRSLQKEQNNTNLLLWPPICRNKRAITPKWETRRLTLHLVTDLSLASYSPFELWSLYIFHISIFFTFQFPMFFLFLGWFFLSWSLCSIVVKMTMYLCLEYGRIGLNWKTITNHYSLVSAMKKIKDLADRFLLVFHKISHLFV